MHSAIRSLSPALAIAALVVLLWCARAIWLRIGGPSVPEGVIGAPSLAGAIVAGLLLFGLTVRRVRHSSDWRLY